MNKLFLVSFFFLAACSNHTTTSNATTHVGLYAHLSTTQQNLTDLNQATIKAVIRNYGPADTTLNTFIYQSSVLVVEVKNDSGEVINSIPPSVPPSDLKQYDHILHTGDSLVYSYPLNIYQVPIRPGKYYARVVGMRSDEIVFTVK